ncbi:MAG TPA: alpha/beta fold hydrolase [Longimicrobiales bacterium]|nr:alpha/beta fold hydrolase [Longimicrobiales bacterium]
MQHAINGVKLHWREAGAGDPVVFIHGFPFKSTMWGPQLEAVPSGWRFIAPDLRGFGNSEAGSEPFSMELFADDVVALLDHLEIDQAVICGLSMGGYVALSMAERYPHRARAQVLVATRASADSAEAQKGRHELAARVRVEGVGPVVDSMLPKLLAGNTRIQRPEVVQFVRNMMQTTNAEVTARALEAMATRADQRATLAKIDVSAMVVRGDQDEIIAREEMDLLARSVRGAKYEVITNVGHLPNLEAPDVFNQTLSHFLNALPAPISIRDMTFIF